MTKLGFSFVALGVVARLISMAPSPVLAQDSPVYLTADRVAAYLDARARHLNYLPGEVLVKFKGGRSITAARRALSGLASRPSADNLQWQGDVALLTDRSQPDSEALAAELASQPDVEYAQPNHFYRLPARRPLNVAPKAIAWSVRPQAVANDTDFNLLQWNLFAVGVPGAWDVKPGGDSSIIAATIDTGVTTVNQTFTFPLFTGASIQNVSIPFTVNPELQASKFVASKDFVPLSGTGGVVLDWDGHGTHVMSTIGETTNNNLALAGIAYNVRLMTIKVCSQFWEMSIARAQAGIPGFIPTDSGFCPDDAIIAGIKYAADNHANTLNISLGGPDASPMTQEAIQYAVTKGTFVSISMGNDFDEGNATGYPAFYAAGINGAMSVAAVDRANGHASYSSSGSYCEIAAPGGDYNPSLANDSGLVWQATYYFFVTDPEFVLIPRFNAYAEIGYFGTSMAAPHVSATAALLFSQTKGKATPAAIEAQIKYSAKDLGAPGKDDLFGHGLLRSKQVVMGSGPNK